MLKISTFTADRTPEEAFAAINNVRGFVVKEIRALKVAPTNSMGRDPQWPCRRPAHGSDHDYGFQPEGHGKARHSDLSEGTGLGRNRRYVFCFHRVFLTWK
jgi:hypothetical protein